MKKTIIVYLVILVAMFIFGKELVLYTFAIGFMGLVLRTAICTVILLPFVVLLVSVIVKACKDKEKIIDVLKFMLVLLMTVFAIFCSGFMMRFEVINTVRDLFAQTETVEAVAYLTYRHNSKSGRSYGHYMLVFYENEDPVPYTQKMVMRISKLEKWYDNHGNQIFPESLIGYDKIIEAKSMGLRVRVTYYPNSRTRAETEILEVLK